MANVNPKEVLEQKLKAGELNIFRVISDGNACYHCFRGISYDMVHLQEHSLIRGRPSIDNYFFHPTCFEYIKDYKNNRKKDNVN